MRAAADDAPRIQQGIVELLVNMVASPIVSGLRPEPTRCSGLLLRPYGERDWVLVMKRLAPLLATSYPGGDQWLSRRLMDVEAGRARAQLVTLRGNLGGIAIETPKAGSCVKLSTLWLAAPLRGRGLGHELLETCTSRWRATGVPSAWITASGAAVEGVGALVTQHGFQLTARERNRYGVGRDEWVFHWSPDSAQPGRLCTQHLLADGAAERTVCSPP